MNSDANIAACLSIGPIVNGYKTSQVLLIFLHSYVVDHGWHTSYQCGGKVLSTWIKFFWKEVNVYKLLY